MNIYNNKNQIKSSPFPKGINKTTKIYIYIHMYIIYGVISKKTKSYIIIYIIYISNICDKTTH